MENDRMYPSIVDAGKDMPLEELFAPEPQILHRKYKTSTIEKFRQLSHDNMFSAPATLHPHQLDTAERLQAFISGQTPGIYLAGTYGTGKTFLARRVASRFINCEVPVYWVNSVRLVKELQDFEAGKGQGDNSPAAIRERLYECPVLILDDLGTERSSPFVQEELYALINERWEHRHERQTLITTNKSGQEVARHIGEAAMSRVADLCERVILNGPDLRQTNNTNGVNK